MKYEIDKTECTVAEYARMIGKTYNYVEQLIKLEIVKIRKTRSGRTKIILK